ncbi:hypothetical protein QBC38DRAFT_136202 [Podospora fimiseda]|uniref:Amine oxidase domain-containing protein n=1 Tax=Podospora fimiseda TaxID=252190 RepID=A0AAN7H4B4_9PEZI|nr:hypothetical protein QBC38DRAFT_136202 [Podospora fimiseda]
MLFRKSQTLLVSLAATSQLVVAQSIINTDVVIIGGGSSGTYAAIQLTDQGKNVVVVEKQSDLGGHAETYTDPATNGKINVGVQAFHNTPIVTTYATRLGVTMAPISYDTPGLNSSTVNIATAQYLNDPTANPNLQAALGKYIQLYLTNYAYLNTGVYLPNPVPADLLMSFGDFAKKHEIEPVVFFFNLFTQGWDISKVPTVYALVTVNLSLLNSIATNTLLGTTDTNDLYTSAASILGSKVLYNADIVLVQRGNTDVTVKVRQGLSFKIIKAKKLLMAAPPTLDNLLGWDLTLQELKLFSKLKGVGYYAAVVSNPSFPDNTSFRNAVPSNVNQFNLAGLPGIFSISNTDFPGKVRTVTYGTQVFLPKELVAPVVLNDINNFLRKAGFGNGRTEILDWHSHGPYNLQVSANDIKNGYYAELFGLQGQKSTFWTGAAWRAQDSSMLWEFTQGLIGSIISGL